MVITIHYLPGISGVSGSGPGGGGGGSWMTLGEIIHRTDPNATGGVVTGTATQSTGTGYIVSSSPPVTDWPFTIAGWAKPTSAGTQHIFSLSDNGFSNRYFSLLSHTNGAMRMNIQDGTNTEIFYSTNAMTAGQWSFVGAVCANTNSRTVYCDAGSPVTCTTSMNFPTAFNDLRLWHTGRTSGGIKFLGTLDNWMLFNTALNTPQMDWIRDNQPTYDDLATLTDANNPGLANLAGYWSLDESSGTRLDQSNSETHMTPDGTLNQVAGLIETEPFIVDSATQFSNTSHMLDSTQYLLSNSDFTVSLWAYADQINTAHSIWGQGMMESTQNEAIGQWKISVVNNGAVNVWHWENAGNDTDGLHRTAANTFAAGQWYHVVFQRTSGAYRLYLDSVNTDISDTRSTTSGWGSYGVVIGRNYTPTGYSWIGRIDEAMYFNTALNTADINALYNDGIGVLARDLVDNTESLPSGAQPIHAWPCSSYQTEGIGEDVGTTGGIDLVPVGTPTVADGIPPGLKLGGQAWRLADLRPDTGNTTDVYQNTFSKRGFLVKNPNNKIVVRYDGSNDSMASAAFTAATQPTTVFVVAKVNSPTTAQGIFDGIATANEHSIRTKTSADLEVDAGTVANTALDVDDGVWAIWVAQFNGASTKVWKNGGVGVTVSAGAESITGVRLGAIFNDTLPLDGEIADTVVLDEASNTARINTIGADLGTKHDITWTGAS